MTSEYVTKDHCATQSAAALEKLESITPYRGQRQPVYPDAAGAQRNGDPRTAMVGLGRVWHGFSRCCFGLHRFGQGSVLNWEFVMMRLQTVLVSLAVCIWMAGC